MAARKQAAKRSSAKSSEKRVATQKSVAEAHAETAKSAGRMFNVSVVGMNAMDPVAGDSEEAVAKKIAKQHGVDRSQVTVSEVK